MFSSRPSLSALTQPFPSLRRDPGAGLTLTDVFAQQAKRGPASFRPAAARILARLEQGDALEEALKEEQKLFPPLLVSLASVGERTGMLPEVFAELERYFLRQQQLRRQFFSQIAWPVTQFVLAVIVLSLLIFVLGQLTPATGPDGRPYDPLGMGLRGASGALIFLAAVITPILAVFALYHLLARLLGGRAAMSRFLLRLPVLGPCLMALALARFCLALQLTTETGMSIGKALRLSLRATGNN